MKLLDLTNRMGYNQLATYNIHWDLKNEEVMISTDFIDVIIDLFPDYYLHDEDSIYISIKNNTVIIDLYIYKPEQ